MCGEIFIVDFVFYAQGQRQIEQYCGCSANTTNGRRIGLAGKKGADDATQHPNTDAARASLSTAQCIHLQDTDYRRNDQ